MSRYQPYSNYKDSGVEWLGEVPEHWEIKRLKFLCRITTGGKDTVNAVADGLYPFYVRSQTIERINSYAYDGEAILTAGDGAGVGKVFHHAYGKFDFHQRVYMLYEFTNINGKYLFEYVKNNFYKVALEGGAKSTVDSLRLPLLQNFEITLPPSNEQAAIANFLDIQTAKIDTLIAKQQRMIELLGEKRSAMISHAVTKGLDLHVKMKDSGVEWLGEVPEHWRMTKLKFIGEAIIGLTYSPNDVTDEKNGILVLRSSNVQNKKITFDDNVYVNAKIPKHLLTQKNDILICSRNGSRSLIGKNAMIDVDSENLTFGAFMTMFRTPYSRYVFWVLNSSIFKYQSGTFLTATINQLTTGNLNNFDIPFPSPIEQTAIVDYLDIQTSKIDTLITKARQAIELMKERRTALISAAVTGKIDVRGMV